MHDLTLFWVQTDIVGKAVALTLLIMSLASWTIMINKASYIAQQHRLMSSVSYCALVNPDLSSHCLPPSSKFDQSVFGKLARAAVDAKRRHESATPDSGVNRLPLSEYLADNLQKSILHIQLELERGMTTVASIGSTAPFVGLLGTVWGIFTALTALGGADRLLLAKVAGPVGEALIMTGAGLFVAIPALLGYNALVRANRVILALADGFVRDTHAWLVAGIPVVHEPPHRG